MFTNDQAHALFERVFEQMLKARWLYEWSFTDGKGWKLGWTAQGAQRAVLLKKMIVAFRLANDDRAPIAFGIFLQREGPPIFSHWRHDDEMAGFWRQCVQELFLQGDGDGLLTLVHIIVGWAPDLETPVKFGARE